MNSIEIVGILKLITQKSKIIRQTYTNYGFSEREINKYLETMIAKNEETDIYQKSIISSYKGPQQLESSKETLSFQKLIITQFEKHKNNVVCYLSKILGNIEHQIEQFRQYENRCDGIILSQIQSQKELESVYSIEKPSSKKLQDLICEQQQKKSHNESTQGQSYTQQQQAQLQNSLQSLIFKTKLLRAMLEKQIISASIIQLKGRPSPFMREVCTDFLIQ